MSSKRLLRIDGFPRIEVRTNARARRVRVHILPEGFTVVVPPRTSIVDVIEVMNSHRDVFLDSYEKVKKKPIAPGFSIDAPCFKLSVVEGEGVVFRLRIVDDKAVVYCPSDADYDNTKTQMLLKNTIVRAMKRQAELLLPPLLKEWADRYDFHYRKVKINGARRRWGSCTSAGTINLSCYLLTLPSELIDYVLLHELCHTRHMNHSSDFYALLNKVSDGNSDALNKQLKNYKPSF